MQSVDLHNLECSICLKTINEPKLLTCSHTFCKSCLERVSAAQHDPTNLSCPICRKLTAVPQGEVGMLQTYQALKSVVDDMKNQQHTCTTCEKEKPPLAVAFCQECGTYMCAECQKVHGQWGSFARHQVVGTSDLGSGKITLRRRATCKKHPNEEASCFCIECRKYICFCAVLEHTRQTHSILQADEHEGDLKENIEGLRDKAQVRKNTINQYITFVEEQQQRLDSVLNQISDSIDEAYNESVQRLTDRRDLLRNEVKRRIDQLEVSLKGMLEASHEQVVQVDAATELVSHGLDAPLEKESLTAHDTLCEELQKILALENPDYKQPSIAAKRGEKILFERNTGTNELDLGRVQVADWAVKHVEFPNSITAMAATPDGNMAVAGQGGVDLFSFEGNVIRTGPKSSKIREIEFLSDGRYVVRDKTNTITLYSKNSELIPHTRFETMRYDEAGVGDLAVDGDDNIYVGYRKGRTIQVFRSTGGRAFREIPCDGFEPSQVFAFKTKKMLVVQSHSNSVRLIDMNGIMKHDVTLYDNIYGYPALCLDDSIMIAWVKHDEGLVSIDQYTNELKHVQTLIADHKIEKPEKRHWYYLQQFTNGAVSFCTPDRMYIFRQSLTAADV